MKLMRIVAVGCVGLGCVGLAAGCGGGLDAPMDVGLADELRLEPAVTVATDQRDVRGITVVRDRVYWLHTITEQADDGQPVGRRMVSSAPTDTSGGGGEPHLFAGTEGWALAGREVDSVGRVLVLSSLVSTRLAPLNQLVVTDLNAGVNETLYEMPSQRLGTSGAVAQRLTWLATNDTTAFVYDSQERAFYAVGIESRAPSRVVVRDLPAPPSGVAASARALYWSDDRSGQVMAVALGDGAVRTPTVIAAQQQQPREVLVAGGYVYWTNAGPGGVGSTGSLMRAPLAGGAASVAVRRVYGPAGLATDGANVFFCGMEEGTIRAVRISASTQLEGTVIVQDQAGPNSVAVTRRGIFWTNQGAQTVMRRARR